MNTEVTNRILTLPNLISLIRLLLVPVFAVMLVGYHNNIAAFVIFLIAASTDFLDGAVARGTGQVSKLGQQLDPLVDRVLILTTVIAVFVVGRVPLWVLLLIVARDLSMLVLLGQLRAAGRPRFKVAFIGKAATAIIMAGFCMLILAWPEVGGLGIIDSSAFPGWGSSVAPLGIWFVYTGTALAWITGIYYMVRAYLGSRHAQNRPQNPPQNRTPNSATARISARGEQGAAVSRRQAGAYSPAAAYSPTAPYRQTAPRSQTASHTQATSHSRGIGARVLGALNTPKKLLIAFAASLLVIIALLFYGCDGISNFGVIHSGVRVGSVDVGHLEEAQAAELLTTDLNAVATSAPVNFFSSEDTKTAGVGSGTQQLGNGINTYNQSEIDYEASSWSVTLATFDAEVNGTRLAEEAYGVGREGDFLLGRLAASTLGVALAPKVDFPSNRLKSLEEMLTRSIGVPMQNADISFDGYSFVAEDGNDGRVVDEEQFKTLLQRAFFSDEREFVVPLVERKMQITLEDATKLAETVQAAITDPVTLSYGESSWSLTTPLLGSCIVTSVEQDEAGAGHLVPLVDALLLEAKLPEITGTIEDQIAPLNARFVVVEEQLQIVPSQNGTGVDYDQLAENLNAALFGADATDETALPAEDVIDDAAPSNETDSVTEGPPAEATLTTDDRTLALPIGVLEPTMQTSDAEAFDFSTKISEFTIEYWWVGQGTITNIHVASDLINSSIIAPQATWSFNETAGECTAEKGFVDAQVILGDEYVDEIGGGVCSVASTVFNAAYEAGYPIVERINHSLRLTRYPLGRDAAIAYPYADLKFQNDTDTYLLLTMTYTDYSVTGTLWGVSPGYTVESVAGDLVEGRDYETKEIESEDLAPGQSHVEQEGKKASKVEVMRTVYDAQGAVKEQRIFYSSYDATPEIVEIGPKIEP
ncbi:MAG: VanW family protein [Coriobacteriales bacterium]|nr:VanW family protein [Coriobacteriales bacterium]